MSRRRGRARRAPWVPPGVVALWKPAGPTSHDLVDFVRSLLPRRARVGHAGTLDPFAEGILPVCVGGATRLADQVGAGEKVYRAVVRLDARTSTADLEGEVLERFEDPGGVTPDAVRDAAGAHLTGEIEQTPPAYSAVRVGGRRAHELAREGRTPELKPRRITVHAWEVLRAAWPEVEVRVTCGRGTYVRTLGEDLGRLLGAGGHLTRLVRERVGVLDEEAAALPFTLLSLEDLSRAFVPLERVLPGVAAGTVVPEARERVLCGNALAADLVRPRSGELREGDEVVLYLGESPHPLAVARVGAGGAVQPYRVFGLPEPARQGVA